MDYLLGKVFVFVTSLSAVLQPYDCFPITDSQVSPNAVFQWEFNSGVLTVLVVICIVVVLAGCLCCQNRKGFKPSEEKVIKKEFNDSAVVVSTENLQSNSINNNSIGADDPGLVNPISYISTSDYTSVNLIGGNSSDQQAILQRTLKTILTDSSCDVSDWFASPDANFPRNKLKYLRELGRGWFGRVIEGEALFGKVGSNEAAYRTSYDQSNNHENAQLVVVRILESSANTREQAQFLREVRFYKNSNHRNVLKLMGRCLEIPPYLIIQEYLNKDLKQHLRETEIIPENFILCVAYELADALLHLHRHNLPYADLAARNCQLSPQLSVKIGDYGLSTKRYPNDYYPGQPPISVRWCAPEDVICTDATIQPKQTSCAGNVWSFGVILWELITHAQQPYASYNDDDVVTHVLQKLQKSNPSNFVGESPENTLYLQEPLANDGTPTSTYTHNIYQLSRLCCTPIQSRPSILQVHSMLKYILSTAKIEIKPISATSPVALSDFKRNESQTIKISDLEFQQRWNAFKPNTITVQDNINVDKQPTDSQEYTAECKQFVEDVQIRDDFQTGASNLSTTSSINLETYVPDNENENKRSRDSSSMNNLAEFEPDYMNLKRVSHLQSAHTEAVNPFVNKHVARLNSGSDDEPYESWLANVAKQEDPQYVKGLSQAMKELDNALAFEKSSSSSETSHQPSPRPTEIFNIPEVKTNVKPQEISRKRMQTQTSDSTSAPVSSASSETEDDETWRKKIECGAYSEQVRIKSKSVADLMVLTHIGDDFDTETDTETPLNSLDIVKLKTLSGADKENGKVYGSDSNLLNSTVHDRFQEELKQLQGNRRDSLLFVPTVMKNRRSLAELSANVESGNEEEDNVEENEEVKPSEISTSPEDFPESPEADVEELDDITYGHFSDTNVETTFEVPQFTVEEIGKIYECSKVDGNSTNDQKSLRSMSLVPDNGPDLIEDCKIRSTRSFSVPTIEIIESEDLVDENNSEILPEMPYQNDICEKAETKPRFFVFKELNQQPEHLKEDNIFEYPETRAKIAEQVNDIINSALSIYTQAYQANDQLTEIEPIPNRALFKFDLISDIKTTSSSLSSLTESTSEVTCRLNDRNLNTEPEKNSNSEHFENVEDRPTLVSLLTDSSQLLPDLKTSSETLEIIKPKHDLTEDSLSDSSALFRLGSNVENKVDQIIDEEDRQEFVSLLNDTSFDGENIKGTESQPVTSTSTDSPENNCNIFEDFNCGLKIASTPFVAGAKTAGISLAPKTSDETPARAAPPDTLRLINQLVETDLSQISPTKQEFNVLRCEVIMPSYYKVKKQLINDFAHHLSPDDDDNDDESNDVEMDKDSLEYVFDQEKNETKPLTNGHTSVQGWIERDNWPQKDDVTELVDFVDSVINEASEFISHDIHNDILLVDKRVNELKSSKDLWSNQIVNQPHQQNGVRSNRSTSVSLVDSLEDLDVDDVDDNDENYEQITNFGCPNATFDVHANVTYDVIGDDKISETYQLNDPIVEKMEKMTDETYAVNQTFDVNRTYEVNKTYETCEASTSGWYLQNGENLVDNLYVEDDVCSNSSDTERICIDEESMLALRSELLAKLPNAQGPPTQKSYDYDPDEMFPLNDPEPDAVYIDEDTDWLDSQPTTFATKDDGIRNVYGNCLSPIAEDMTGELAEMEEDKNEKYKNESESEDDDDVFMSRSSSSSEVEWPTPPENLSVSVQQATSTSGQTFSLPDMPNDQSDQTIIVVTNDVLERRCSNDSNASVSSASSSTARPEEIGENGLVRSSSLSSPSSLSTKYNLQNSSVRSYCSNDTLFNVEELLINNANNEMNKNFDGSTDTLIEKSDLTPTNESINQINDSNHMIDDNQIDTSCDEGEAYNMSDILVHLDETPEIKPDDFKLWNDDNVECPEKSAEISDVKTSGSSLSESMSKTFTCIENEPENVEDIIEITPREENNEMEVVENEKNEKNVPKLTQLDTDECKTLINESLADAFLDNEQHFLCNNSKSYKKIVDGITDNFDVSKNINVDSQQTVENVDSSQSIKDQCEDNLNNENNVNDIQNGENTFLNSSSSSHPPILERVPSQDYDDEIRKLYENIPSAPVQDDIIASIYNNIDNTAHMESYLRQSSANSSPRTSNSNTLVKLVKETPENGLSDDCKIEELNDSKSIKMEVDLYHQNDSLYESASTNYAVTTEYVTTDTSDYVNGHLYDDVTTEQNGSIYDYDSVYDHKGLGHNRKLEPIISVTDDLYTSISDIRLDIDDSNLNMMSTSFSEEQADDKSEDWDDDVNGGEDSCGAGSNEDDSSRSSSSGEFVWKDGEREESVHVKNAIGATNSENQNLGMNEKNNDSSSCTSDDDSDGDEDDDGVEFVPSAWDSEAAPIKSALRSPDRVKTKQSRNVWFKKQKYHCVYEYPREPDYLYSPVSSSQWQSSPSSSFHHFSPVNMSSLWNTPTAMDLSTFADWELDNLENALEDAVKYHSNEHDDDFKSEKYMTTPSASSARRDYYHRSAGDLYRLANVPSDIDFTANAPATDDDFYLSSTATSVSDQTDSNSPSLKAPDSGKIASPYGACQFFPGGYLSYYPTSDETECEQKRASNILDLANTLDKFHQQLSVKITPDSGVEDITPASSCDVAEEKRRNKHNLSIASTQVLSLKQLAAIAVERKNDGQSPTTKTDGLSPSGIGRLRHARDKLKLDLTSAITSASTTPSSAGSYGDDTRLGDGNDDQSRFKRNKKPTFTTFGKTRFSITHVETPTSESPPPGLIACTNVPSVNSTVSQVNGLQTGVKSSIGAELVQRFANSENPPDLIPTIVKSSEKSPDLELCCKISGINELDGSSHHHVMNSFGKIHGTGSPDVYDSGAECCSSITSSAKTSCDSSVKNGCDETEIDQKVDMNVSNVLHVKSLHSSLAAQRCRKFVERGEASLLDSTDEDSGIESTSSRTATLERRIENISTVT